MLWLLKIGASLEFGFWCLELPPPLKKGGGDPAESPPPVVQPSCVLGSAQLRLRLRGVVHFFRRFFHVLMRLLHAVSFLLLIRRKQRTDLRHGVVQHRF